MASPVDLLVSPHPGGVGATISGVDLADLTGDQFAAVDAAWAEHGLVVFRDQELSPDGHLALARRFDGVDVNRYFQAVENYPEIALVSKEPDDAHNIGGGWHTDHSYDQVPARGSILVAREVPESGGDTHFVDVGAAFESLSEGLKDTLRGLRAVHSSAFAFSEELLDALELRDRLSPSPPVETVHPVVVAHPRTGRELLYVNPGFTTNFQGWTVEESKPLLGYLFSVIESCGQEYRLRWEPGTVAMWDNRSTWHMAVNDYPGQRRVMHRTTITGEALAPA